MPMGDSGMNEIKPVIVKVITGKPTLGQPEEIEEVEDGSLHE